MVLSLRQVLAFALLTIRLDAQDWREEFGTPFIHNYPPKIYKAGTQNWCAAQDRRGIMYFGNRDGVMEYDGVSWKIIRVPNRTLVRSLAADSSGKIYVGAKGDLGFLTPGSDGRMHFTSLLDKISVEQRDFTDVWKIHVLGEWVLFETDVRLFWLDAAGDSITSLAATTRFHRSFVANDRVYVTQRGLGLYTVTRDSLVVVPHGSRFAPHRIYSILPFDRERMLIATMEEGLFLLSAESVERFESPANAFLREYQVYCGRRLRNGLFVFGTRSGGAVAVDSMGQIRHVFNKSSGLQDDGVLHLFQDADLGLWMTLNNGISRVEVETPMTRLGEGSGLHGTVYSICRFANTLYVGTDIGVFQLHPGQHYPMRFERVVGIKGQSWAFWSDGRTLLTGNAEAIYRIVGNQAGRIQEWPHGFCFHRSTRDSNMLFVGLPNGLGILRQKNGLWHAEGMADGIHDEIRSIGESADGSLWLGTRASGLIRAKSDGGTWTVKHVGSGLPPGGIHVLHIQGRSLFSGRGGLYEFNESTSEFKPDTLLQPLLPQDSMLEVAPVTEDLFGRIWLFDFAEQKSEVVVAARKPDGSYELDRRYLARLSDFEVGAFLPEEDGIVWIGGSDGLVRYDTRIAAAPPSLFSTCLRSITLRDSILYGGAGPVPEALTLPSRLEKFRLEFAGTFYDNEAATNYQYWLEGLDDGWSTWTSETWKDYSHLPAGDYRFRVRARNVYGVLAEEAVFRFTVLPPWYLTWWAFVLYGAALLLSLAWTVKYRSRHLEDDKKRLEALVEERTEKISKQNEELHRLYDKQNEFMGIVAHDLRSPLSAIVNVQSMMSEEIDGNSIDRDEWKENLAMINRAATRMVVLINDLLDISAIESGKLTLQLQDTQLGSLVEECSRIHVRSAVQKKIEVSVESRTDLPLVRIDKRRIAEVIDNLLSNAIKFTFPGGRVCLTYEIVEQEVAVHVEDTGQGLTEQDLKELFAGFKKLSSQPTGGESSTGLGLVIVKKIVELHGGRVRAKSTRGLGTTFTFTLPQSLTA